MSAEISTTNSTTAADPLSDPLTPPLEALYWTQYGTWYPIFRKHAPKSTIIDIDAVQPELLDWLDSETFVLPDGSGPSTSTTSDLSSASSASSSRGEAGDDSDSDEQAVRLPELDAAIRSVVSNYESAVFPKLNWSAPLDASFMLAGNTLQCRHPEDVYLLLKSSEFAGRDLEQISATATASASVNGHESIEFKIRPQLVLKKWFALNRSYEFRCFVRSRALIAISQRDVTFYEHLQSPMLQSKIRSAIWEFYEQVVKAEHRWRLADFVMDVYLTKGLDRVWLVDVNPWLPRTDPLLWDYEALEAVHRRERLVRSASAPSASSEVAEQNGEGVVRLHLSPPNPTDSADQKERSSPPLWGEADPQLRILSDRRLTAGGGTGATYSSNMVPTDLVEFAKNASGSAMSVDQIVKRWNDSIDAEGA